MADIAFEVETDCPCCHGKGKVKGLEAIRMRRPSASSNAEKIIVALLDRPKGMTAEQRINHIWDGPDGGPLDANNALQTHKCFARNLLRPFGWTISKKKRGLPVYRLECLNGSGP